MGGKLTGNIRFSYEEAKAAVDAFIAGPVGQVGEWPIAGSLRRHKLDVGDVDCVVVADEAQRNAIQGLLEVPLSKPGKMRCNLSVLIPTGNPERPNLQLDIMFVTPEQVGAALMHFTGPVGLNIKQRAGANRLGMMLNFYLKQSVNLTGCCMFCKQMQIEYDPRSITSSFRGTG